MTELSPAALAGEPAVPAPPADGEVAEPTREELWELWLRLNNELPDRPAAVAEFWEHARVHTLALIRPRPAAAGGGTMAELSPAALAGEPAVPAPPADGEVAECAAELLERQALVPVSVSERLPGPEDCDAKGRCWWGTPSFANNYIVTQSAQWRLCAPDDRFGSELLWLPAHALPLPEVSE